MRNGPYMRAVAGAAFPGVITSSLDIYLNVASPALFTWDTMAFHTDGSYLMEFYMLGGSDGHGGIAIAANDNNSVANPALDTNRFTVTTSGWYTFQNELFNNGGLLADRATLLKNGVVQDAWLLQSGQNITQVGGKTIGWFAGLDRPVAIDNASVATPEPGTFMLLLGLAPVLYAARKRFV
jgi:hypothetical protein